MRLRHVGGFAAGAALVLLAGGDLAAQEHDRTALDTLTAAAKTADAHRALAARYLEHAKEHEADAAAHERIAVDARKASDDDAWDLARDAAHYAQHSREAAAALRDLAELHGGLADRLETSKTPEGCCAKPAALAPAPPPLTPGANDTLPRSHKH